MQPATDLKIQYPNIFELLRQRNRASAKLVGVIGVCVCAYAIAAFAVPEVPPHNVWWKCTIAFLGAAALWWAFVQWRSSPTGQHFDLRFVAAERLATLEQAMVGDPREVWAGITFLGQQWLLAPTIVPLSEIAWAFRSTTVT